LFPVYFIFYIRQQDPYKDSKYTQTD